MRRRAPVRNVLLAAFLALSLRGACATATPADAAAFAWQAHPGAQVPPDTVLRDESGRTVPLRQFLGSQPVILDLGYFRCPALCGVVRADLLNALRGSGLVEGRDYRLVALSIDPAETPKEAAQAKEGDLSQAPFATGADWHYVTGSAESVAAVTQAVGFRDRYDSRFRQFLHPTGLVVLTKAGVVSGYLLGVGFAGGDLRASVLRAQDGGIAQTALPILLLCFHYDAATGHYTLAIEKVLRLMGLLTVVTLGGLLLALHWPKAVP
jgi:protein SCO1/2